MCVCKNPNPLSSRPIIQRNAQLLKESRITFCLLVRYPSTWVLSCRRPSRCTRNGRLRTSSLRLRTSNAPNLGSRSVLIGCWNFPMSWCWKRKRMRCFDHQTLLKERARVTGIEIDLLNLRFLLSRRRLRAQASKGCVMREKRFHSSCHVPKSHA